MKHRLQQVLLLVFYTISMVALSIPLVQLVTKLSPDNLFPLLASLLLYLVLAVALGCLIHTITYIPSNLATEFDPIKNDICTGEIKDTEELGRRLSHFVTSFFDFAFLDIDFAFLHTEQSGLVSCGDLPRLSSAMDQFEMLEKSKTFKEIMRAGKVTLAEEDYHLYVLPIWIGDQWLGYMGLLSKRRIGRYFQQILAEFENNFLDDQLLLVIRISQSPGV